MSWPKTGRDYSSRPAAGERRVKTPQGRLTARFGIARGEPLVALRDASARADHPYKPVQCAFRIAEEIDAGDDPSKHAAVNYGAREEPTEPTLS